MKNGLVPVAAAAAERCVTLKTVLLGSAELRVNESVLIPEGTLVDAAANTAVINRGAAACEAGKGNQSSSEFQHVSTETNE